MANPSKATKRFDTFGPLPRDANRQPLAVTGNYFATEDAAASPILSPVSVTSGAAVPLTIPAAATQVTIIASNPIQVSEDPAMGHFMVIPANTPMTFPCLTPSMDGQLSNTGIIYLQAVSTTAVTQFMFNCV